MQNFWSYPEFPKSVPTSEQDPGYVELQGVGKGLPLCEDLSSDAQNPGKDKHGHL